MAMGIRPTFLLLGAPRSGTTALYEGLRARPDVFLPAVKEPLFFLRDGRSRSWYSPGGAPRGAEAITTWDQYLGLFADAGRFPVRGDASTLYLYDAHAAGRIAARLPQARFIAILRDPVARAYSQYCLHRLRGTEPRTTFEEALAEEPARLRDGWSPFWLYRDVGRYAAQLHRYLSLVGPERLLVLLHEDVRDDPAAASAQIYRFLGIAERGEPSLVTASVNGSGVPRGGAAARLLRAGSPWVRIGRRLLPSAARRGLRELLTQPPPPLAVRTARELRAFYRDDIAETARLLGRDLSHWMEPGIPPAASVAATGRPRPGGGTGVGVET
jgi:hypothetical protein